MEESRAMSVSCSPLNTTEQVLTAVLDDFYQGKDTVVLTRTCKVLATLVQNALREDDPKYHCIRLTNPKIQTSIVNVPGALDILALAGFGRDDKDPNVLIFAKQQQDAPTAYRETCTILGTLLALKNEELQVASSSPSSSSIKRSLNIQPASNKTTTNDDAAVAAAPPFLSEEERQRRLARAKEARRVKEAERQRALAKWKEDEQERLAKAARKAAVKMDTTDADATESPLNVRIKRLVPPPRPQAKQPPAALASKSLPPPPPPPPCTISQVSPEMAACWKQCLESIPRCAAAEGICATSVYKHQALSGVTATATCLRRVVTELDSLATALPQDLGATMFVRFDEERPQFVRAVIPGALPGPTPYAGGVFCFDVFLPDNYPQVSPKVTLLTTGGGSVRFGPNLYADGKVCLSILGTWSGPKWEPDSSTLAQVLVSIQGLVLGAEHPFYLEPGHGGWEGEIKQGDFSQTGYTLSGKNVCQQVLPLEVATYETKLRVGTLRFAMLDMLRVVTTNTTELPAAYHYLQPFQRALACHFYYNRSAILTEVNSWVQGCVVAKSPTSQQPYSQECETQLERMNQQIQSLYTKLQAVMGELTEPSLSNESNDTATTQAMDTASQQDDEDSKMPAVDSIKIPTDDTKMPAVDAVMEEAAAAASPTQVAAEAAAVAAPPVTLEGLREEMQQAARAGDFIRAGELQAQLQPLLELERNMQEAAAAGNFVRAGRLQEQLQARLAAPAASLDDLMKQSQPPGTTTPGTGPMNVAGFQDPMDQDDFNSSDDDDDGFMHPHGGPAGHAWGAGFTLATDSSSQVASKPTSKPMSKPCLPPYQSQRSSGQTCRLCIHLPTGSPVPTINEVFDVQDTVADLYEHVGQYVTDEPTCTNNSAAVARSTTRKRVWTAEGSEIVEKSPFARPLSQKGFTIKITNPNRELSLEMHGARTLKDMNLGKGIALYVMRCHDRGVVLRGDLEARLRAAQGDAMDLEGMTYESLLELEERLGGRDTGWTPELQANLEASSTIHSPAAFVQTCTDEKDRRCAICLGDFLESDEKPTLRQLNVCKHAFHNSCLATWLQKRKACPLCNSDIV